MLLYLWIFVFAFCQWPIQCARIRRVVGGEPMAVGEWPWLVSLHYNKSHGYLKLQGLKHICAGSLINRYWILTAAHCFDEAVESSAVPAHWMAVLGEYNRRVDESSEQHLEVDKLFLYHNYSIFPKFTGDMALIKLRTPATITSYVNTIALDTDREIAPDTTCKAGGWGQHDDSDDQYGNGTIVPHIVELDRVSQTTCEAKYENKLPLIDDTVICFASDQRRDTCKGDSGGPLVCKNSAGNSVVSGVTSLGQGCADASFPGVYTRVASYRSWITTTMANNPTS